MHVPRTSDKNVSDYEQISSLSVANINKTESNL